MNFQDFSKLIPKLKSMPLPGVESHFKMASLARKRFTEKHNFENLSPKKAAVLLLLYPKNEQTHLILIQRNTYQGVHSAQIAFPGGKKELEDKNYENTALRETHEEIGIKSEDIEIIMPMTSLYIPPSNFDVFPFLGMSNKELNFILNPKEVVSIIEFPLNTLLNDEIVIETEVKTSYSETILCPAFKIDQHLVWGATAMMLNELKEILKKST